MNHVHFEIVHILVLGLPVGSFENYDSLQYLLPFLHVLVLQSSRYAIFLNKLVKLVIITTVTTFIEIR